MITENDVSTNIIKDGYSVEFSENNILGMTKITDGKYGKTAEWMGSDMIFRISLYQPRSSLRVWSGEGDVYSGDYSSADR